MRYPFDLAREPSVRVVFCALIDASSAWVITHLPLATIWNMDSALFDEFPLTVMNERTAVCG